MTFKLSAQQREHFAKCGWLRIPGAFSARDARAMCEVIWSALEATGIERHHPETWTKARPEHLQHLKSHPVFRAVGTQETVGAIRSLMTHLPWEEPTHWGAFFLQFPSGDKWTVPSAGWHLDGNYSGALNPPCGVLVHAMLTHVEPRAGAVIVLSGSHQLVHRWFTEHPAPKGARAVQLRRSLEQHAYLKDLSTPADPAARIKRFHEHAENVDGITLQVLENVAAPGDVILMHSLLLHAAAPAAHLGTSPRFMLSRGFQVPYW